MINKLTNSNVTNSQQNGNTQDDVKTSDFHASFTVI